MRFLFIDIETDTAKMTSLEYIDKRLFINERAAPNIDEVGVRLHRHKP